MTKQKISRRGFLKNTAGTVGAAALAPYVITTNALGRDGIPPASDRIVWGSIGTGGMGMGDMGAFLRDKRCQIVAVCDVDRSHAEEARDAVNKYYGNRDCAITGDFREVLAKGDIDAVNIATVDHWHALITIAACKAGMDIYCQKPLSCTIEEGQKMVAAVRRYGRIFQVGTQQRSDATFRFACELVRSGYIGQLQHIDVFLPTGPRLGENPAPQPVPEKLDYDLWQGPVQVYPYCKERVHFNFRWLLAYTPGMITDWGAHHNDIAQWGHGTDHTGPVEIRGTGYFPPDSLWDAATDFDIHYTYADGVTQRCTNKGGARILFTGTEGSVEVARGGYLRTKPNSLKSVIIRPGDVHLYQSENHYRNLVDCVYTRKEPVAPIEIAHRSVSVCHLGNIACQLGRTLHWDPSRERFIGDPEAEKMLSRANRAPWTL